jgi:hypothetical protein
VIRRSFNSTAEFNRRVIGQKANLCGGKREPVLVLLPCCCAAALLYARSILPCAAALIDEFLFFTYYLIFLFSDYYLVSL